MREVDRVAHDVGLLGQRRLDVDGRVGDQQDPVVGRHVHDEGVAHAPLGAQPGLGGHDLAEQLVGVQAALHEHLDLARPRERRGRRGRGVAVLRGHDADAGEVGAVRLCHRADAGGRTDQHGHDQPAAGRLERAEQRVAVAGMRHRAGDGLERLALPEQPREHVVATQDDLGRGDVGVRDARARRLDHHRARDDAALAHAGIAVEHDEPGVGVLLAHGHRGREFLADPHLARVIEPRRDDARARARQPALEQPGDHRAHAHCIDGEQLVRHPAAVLEVEGLDVARDEHQRLDLRLGQRAPCARRGTDLELVEGDVAVVAHDRSIQVVLSSVYLSKACSDLSRPMPDCLKPPNGTVMSSAS